MNFPSDKEFSDHPLERLELCHSLVPVQPTPAKTKPSVSGSNSLFKVYKVQPHRKVLLIVRDYSH